MPVDWNTYNYDFDPIPPSYTVTFDIINIDTGDVVETLDTIEDAREFINIHASAENLAILRVEGRKEEFVD